mmetsp:Transcript_60593/g.132691  ORF Transcript_60593/g.132691 Transcript_60593/m.132691 type:complete len:248 (-) Transcript_60593:32-775(-)
MCLGTSEIGQSVNNISIPVAKCQNSRRSKLPPSAVAEILAAAAQASQEAPNRAVKRRVRQRLHKKLGSLLTCEEFGRAMERFRIMEEESGAGATPEACSQGPTSSASTNVLPTRCSPQLIALPIFVPMMTPPQALQAPAASRQPPAGAICRIPISLAGAALVKPEASTDKKEAEEDMPSLELEEPSSSSKAQSESETTTDDEAELESFTDLRIEWVRATSEGPLPVERTFIQFNTRTHVQRRRSKSL